MSLALEDQCISTDNILFREIKTFEPKGKQTKLENVITLTSIHIVAESEDETDDCLHALTTHEHLACDPDVVETRLDRANRLAEAGLEDEAEGAVREAGDL